MADLKKTFSDDLDNLVIEFDEEWGVKAYVPTDMLRQLIGFEVVGIEDRVNQESGEVTGKNLVKADGWLDKWFMVFVPKGKDAVFNITARGNEGNPSSVQLQVKDGFLSKISYRDTLAHFGDASAKQQQVAAKRTSGRKATRAKVSA